MIITALIIGGLAFALYHNATITQKKIKEVEELLSQLEDVKKHNDELLAAYRDALRSLDECKQDHHEDGEYC